MSDVTCRGSFALGTACMRCSKCKAEIEEYEVRKTVRESLDGTSVLKMQVTGWQNVAQVNGAVADQAKAEVARLTARLAEVDAAQIMLRAERDGLASMLLSVQQQSITATKALATARRDALEEAANEVDCGGCVNVGCVDPTNCWHKAAQDIRALIAQEEPKT